MTVFVTPSGEPFYGGTYYPPEPRHQMPSFQQVMSAIDDAWRNRRSDVKTQAEHLTGLLERSGLLMAGGDSVGADEDAEEDEGASLEKASERIVAAFDPEWGGFGGAPKFPGAMTLCSAIHQSFLTIPCSSGARLTEGLESVYQRSLDAMAAGGIYDHLGGGFCRYSVDRQWLVPHFEKMLYDNALLTRAYIEAWQVTGKRHYLTTASETIEYVLRDLRHDDGGFYSAEDADSEGVEGKFYVWSEAELKAVAAEVLGADIAEEAIEWWQVTSEGNFEGANILHRPLGEELNRPKSIEQAKQVLFEHRARRVRPGLDDKVLTEWNGLMLSSLAQAAAATQNQDWKDAAIANGEFLLANMRRDDGRWMRSWQAATGEARHLGYANDYAAVVDAFVRLGELTGEARWIEEAITTADDLIRLFSDPDSPGFFTTGDDAEQLVVRPKDVMDNATPSAQSLAAIGLMRLGALTGNESYSDCAAEIVDSLALPATQHPTAFGLMLEAVTLSNRFTQIVITGERGDLIKEVHARYLPTVVLAWGESYESPLWKNRELGFAYVCQDYACQLPVDSSRELSSQLDWLTRPFGF